MAARTTATGATKRPDDDIERMRSFNRCWTEVLGLLDQDLLSTEHSLAEARVIFELTQRT